MATAKVQVNARLDPDIYSMLAAFATAHGVSVSASIEDAVQGLVSNNQAWPSDAQYRAAAKAIRSGGKAA